MKRWLLLFGFLLLTVLFSIGPAHAAVVPCPSSTTLDVLLSFNSLANACSSQDTLFWNFQYTPGPNSPAASSVSASLIFQFGSGVDIHGWNFSSIWSQSVTTSALANFTLAFTTEICPSPTCPSTPPGDVIHLADAVYAPSAVSTPGPETVNWSNGATVTLTSGSPGPLPSNGNIGLGAGTTGPIMVTANFAGTGTITQTSLRFYNTDGPLTTVPEPNEAILMLIGIAMASAVVKKRLRAV